MENVMYHPEAYGLVELFQVELAEPDYSFDILACLKGDKGYYLATDSGCSCPSPFESYGGIDDLTGPLTAEQAREEATALWSGSYGGGYDKEAFEEALTLIV